MTLTSSAWVVFGARRAMTASSIPLSWDVVRLHHCERCAHTPGPIAGSKLVTRDAHRELYDIFCNIVGSILSPLFANIYLDRMDKLALKRGLKLVRYGDDMVVCCRSQDEAEGALKLLQKLLGKLDLEANPRKTAIFHAEKGFRFLGQQLFLKATGNGDLKLVGWSQRAAPRSLPALSASSSSRPTGAPSPNADEENIAEG